MSKKDSIVPKLFSLGFRCSTAAIIKQIEMKTESFPFDWLVSDLSVIRHCIETDFSEFTNLKNYERRYTSTYEMADSKESFICDEQLMVNTYYQPPELMNAENTYKYKLAMNHHNIFELKDMEYYNRCIERFRSLLNCDNNKIYIHIRHLVTREKYETEKDEILKEFIEFDDFITSRFKGTLKGIYFILIKDKLNSSVCDSTSSSEPDIHSTRLQPNGELIHESKKTGTRIYTLNVNRDFIDAGETFMGEYYKEVLYIKNEILNFI